MIFFWPCQQCEVAVGELRWLGGKTGPLVPHRMGRWWSAKNTNQFGFTAVWTFPPLQRKRSLWHKKKKSYEHAGLIFVFWYYGIIIRSQNSIYLLIITQPHNQDDCGWYPSNMNVVRELQLFTDFILFYISFGTGIVSILIRICIFSSLQNKMDSLIQFHLGLGDRFCIGDLRTENYENFKLKLQKNLNLYFKEVMNPYLKSKVNHQNIGRLQKLNLPWSWRVRRNPSRRARWVGEGGAGGAVRRNRLKLSLSKWISKCKRNGIRR